MVSELPDDLINQVLIRLPVKSIFKFKSVSNTWNRFLSGPEFRRSYHIFHKKNSSSSSSSPLLGVFQFQVSTTPPTDASASSSAAAKIQSAEEEEGEQLRRKVSFLSTCEQGLPSRSHDFMEKLGFFHDSSCGLVVCGHHPVNYYVCNPVTNQWVSLPQPNNEPSPSEDIDHVVGIYCEEKDMDDGDFRHSYKVVRADVNRTSRDKTIHIETYDSDTGAWSGSTVKGATTFSLLPTCMCTSVKGTFFWIARNATIGAYNPDTAKDRLWLIQMPPIMVTRMAPNLGESADGLIQCAMDDVEAGFRIFVLNRELDSYSYANVVWNEWVLRHTVSVDIPGMVWYHPIYSRTCSRSERRQYHPRRLAFHPGNPRILYVRVGQSLFCCDIANGTITSVPYQGNLLPCDAKYNLLPYFQPEWPLSPML